MAGGRRWVVRLLAHLVLGAGAVLFATPFLWLVSSSFKDRDEIFATPMRWLPGLPARVQDSPYLQRPSTAGRPREVPEAIWTAIEEDVRRRAAQRIRGLAPAGLESALDSQVGLMDGLVQGTLDLVCRRAGTEVAVKSAAEIVEELCRVALEHEEVVGVWGPIVDRIAARPDGVVATSDELDLPRRDEGPRDLWLAAWNRGVQVMEGYLWEDRLQAKFARPEVWEDFVFGMGALLWEGPLADRGSYRRQRTPAQVADFLLHRVDAEAVERVWTRIYRHVLLGPLVAELQDGRRMVLLDLDALGQPQEQTGVVAPGPILTAAERPGRQLGYRFAGEDEGRLVYALERPPPVDQIQRLVLPVRGDRSFHEIGLRIEIGDAVYRARQPFVLGNDRWMEAIWTFDEPTLRERRTVYYAAELTPLDRVAGRPSRTGDAVVLEVRRVDYARVLWRRFSTNYAGALLAVPFATYLRNTVLITLLNIVGQALSCSLIAYGFARLRWPGRDYVFAAVLATMMLPPQVTMIPQFLIWRALGQYDTFQPLWVPSLFGSGFFIFLMRQFMLTIPRELEDAARIDGCGFLATYWHVVMPLLKPALATVCVFQFMGSWNDFLNPLIYLSSESKATLALGLFRFKSSHFVGAVGEVGLLMAASVLMVLPVIALFFFAQRYFIQGITFTGMKN